MPPMPNGGIGTPMEAAGTEGIPGRALAIGFEGGDFSDAPSCESMDLRVLNKPSVRGLPDAAAEETAEGAARGSLAADGTEGEGLETALNGEEASGAYGGAGADGGIGGMPAAPDGGEGGAPAGGEGG